MSARLRRPVRAALLGSAAARVAATSTLPVVVLPEPAEQAMRAAGAAGA